MQPFELSVGSTPLLVSMPHGGTYIPDDVKSTMTDQALRLPDTDWHVPVLYDFVRQLDVSVLAANYSRYYIDVNRSRNAVPTPLSGDNTFAIKRPSASRRSDIAVRASCVTIVHGTVSR